MAAEAEEVVIVFTSKGADGTVREVDKVRKSTEKLDKQTDKVGDNDGWDRYAKASESALGKVWGFLSKSDKLMKTFANSMVKGLGGLVRGIETEGVGLAGAFRMAGTSAASAFHAGLVGTSEARGLRGVLGTATKMLRGFGVGGALGGLAVLGGGIAAAVGAAKFIGWGKGGQAGASDRTEAMNMTDSLLGGGSARRALGANPLETADRMGLTQGQYLSAYGGFAGQLKGAGLSNSAAAAQAKLLVQGAADLGSFKNVSSQDAAERLSAGVRGEFDSLDTIGIMLNQSQVDKQAMKMFGKKTQQLDIDKQVQARVAAITSSAGWSQAKGDFSRSLPTSAANQQKVLESEQAVIQQRLGESLNRITTSLTPLFMTLNRGLLLVVDRLTPLVDAVAGAIKTATDMIKELLPRSVAQRNNRIATGRSPFTRDWNQIGGGALMSTWATPEEAGGSLAAGINPLTGGAMGGGDWLSTLGGFTIGGGRAEGGMIPGWSPGIDNQMVPMSGGEGVLTPWAAKMLGGAKGVAWLNRMGKRHRGMAGGGMVAVDHPGSVAKLLQGVIPGIYTQGAGAGAPGPDNPTTATPGGAGVMSSDAFLALARQVLIAKGMNPGDAVHILHQAEHESSLRYNPPVPDDVNMHNGSGGSWGILQFIRSTFDAYKDPGYNNFLGVEDQIRALTNYVPAKYGSIAALGARGYGAYDSGGWLPPGGMAVSNLDKPEAILNPEQWETMKAAADRGTAGVTVSIGTITIGVGAGGDAVASSIRDELADAIAVRITRQNDRRL